MSVVGNLKQLAKISEASAVSCISLGPEMNVNVAHLQNTLFNGSRMEKVS